MTQKFCHLHLHTDYSLLDGAMKTEDLIKQAKNHNMQKIAVTNHGNVVNMPKIIQEAAKEGVQVIPGSELYVSWDYPRTVMEKERYQAYHMVALAKNEVGYKNLLKLVTEGHLTGRYRRPRVDRELLEQHKEGLIFLSACLNGVLNGRFIKEEKTKEDLDEDIRWMKEVLDGQLYFEIQRHPQLEVQDVANEMVIEKARQHGFPLVATCDSHYAYQEHHDAWRMMMMMSMPGKPFDVPNDYYVKSQEQMEELFPDVPEAIENTMVIANQCEPITFDGSYKFPVFDTGKLTDKEYIKRESYKGLDLRMAENGLGCYRDMYVERLDMELDIIDRMGFNSYHLVVSDFILWAKANGIGVGPGRGSAAGSLAAWCLGITEVNPLQYGLLFERYLNPDRISMPDIDMDFADDRRDEVKGYAVKKYGKDKVASIMTIGTMAAKGALRDVARCTDVNYTDSDTLAKAVPDGVRGKNVYLRTITDPEHEDYNEDFVKLANSRSDYKEVLRIALIMEGMTRNVGTHAAGVVISDHKPLIEHCALMLDKEGNVVTQDDMKVLEKIIGLVKFDFLGLSTLTTLQMTCRFIKENYDIDIDIDKIPLDCQETYDLLCRGNLGGVFQLDGSSGFKDVVMQIQPRSIEEIADITSLYRPGPLDNGFIPKYVKAKNTGEIEYMIQVANEEIQKQINECLQPTKGVLIYQEQVMKLVQIMAGYTLAQADLLRRIMGKKIPSEMEEQRGVFVEGCLNTGVNKEEATKAFDAIAKFAEYGINKSHAIAYSLISYQTAWLRTHYPIEFMAATLTEVAGKGDRDKTITFLNDCKANEIKVLPPSINESKLAYTPTKDGIKFGLGAIKSLGDVAVNEIVKKREKDGAYRSLTDFCSRVDISKVNTAKISTLIRAGCFDEVA